MSATKGSVTLGHESHFSLSGLYPEHQGSYSCSVRAADHNDLEKSRPSQRVFILSLHCLSEGAGDVEGTF